MSQYIYSLIEELPTGAATPPPPGLTYNWPLPTAVQSVAYQGAQPQGRLPEYLVSVALPIGLQRDWPNAPRAVPQAVNTQPLGVLPEYLGVVATPLPPGLLRDQPNPRGVPQPPHTQQLGVAPEYLVFLATPLPPGLQRDWQLTRGFAQFAQNVNTQPQGSATTFLPSLTGLPPALLRDWPNPRTNTPSVNTQSLGVLPGFMAVATVSVTLNATDHADVGNFNVTVPLPPAPVVPTVNPYAGFQGGSGGIQSKSLHIPMAKAKELMRQWYDTVGFRWLDDRPMNELRPSERSYLMDEVRQSPQTVFLLQNGYTMPQVYALINEAREDSIEDDDGEALAALLD